MSLFFLAAAGKTVGFMRKRENPFLSIPRIGAYGRNDEARALATTLSGFHSSRFFSTGSLASLASSSARSLAMVRRFEGSVSVFSNSR